MGQHGEREKNELKEGPANLSSFQRVHVDCKCRIMRRLAKGSAPHEVWLILGIIASNSAGVDLPLTVQKNKAATAFDSLQAAECSCPGQTMMRGSCWF